MRNLPSGSGETPREGAGHPDPGGFDGRGRVYSPAAWFPERGAQPPQAISPRSAAAASRAAAAICSAMTPHGESGPTGIRRARRGADRAKAGGDGGDGGVGGRTGGDGDLAPSGASCTSAMTRCVSKSRTPRKAGDTDVQEVNSGVDPGPAARRSSAIRTARIVRRERRARQFSHDRAGGGPEPRVRRKATPPPRSYKPSSEPLAVRRVRVQHRGIPADRPAQDRRNGGRCGHPARLYAGEGLSETGRTRIERIVSRRPPQADRGVGGTGFGRVSRKMSRAGAPGKSSQKGVL